MDLRAESPVPYHVVPGPVAPKRILLISYHAPPSNAVGALRWTGMARHFATHGWGFDILALDPAALSSRSEALLGDLPPGTRLFGVPEGPPPLDRFVDGLVRVRQRFRTRLRIEAPSKSGAVPVDAASGPRMSRRAALDAFNAWREYVIGGQWGRRAAAAGRRIFDPRLHHWVASSGPPHMSHEGGRLLAAWTGLPWIADFRDPWRFSEWVSLGPTWLRLAAKYEARVVRNSTLTLTNVEPVRSLMQRAYPTARIITITNGVDEGLVAPPPASDRFIIGYPGAIYLGRDPEPLVDAVGRLVRDLGLTAADLGLEFMGFFEPHLQERLRRLGERHGVTPFLAVHEGRPRTEAHEFMRTCSVLVALQQGSDLAIPAKMFEYMRFPSWLLVIAGKHSATADLLAGTTADVHQPEDVAGMQGALARRYQEFRSTGRPAPLGVQERFGRRLQVERLLDAMEAAKRAPQPVTPARAERATGG